MRLFRTTIRVADKLLLVCAALVIVGLAGCGSTRSTDPVLLGDQKVEGLHAQLRPGRAEAFEFTALRSGRVTHAHVYIGPGSSAGRLVVGIYQTTERGQGGRSGLHHQPGRLMTSGAVPALKAGRWDRVSLRPAHLNKGARYWVALLGVGGNVSFRRARDGTTTYSIEHARLSALPARYTPGAYRRAGPASVYVGGIAGNSIGSPGGPSGGPPSGGSTGPGSPPSSAQCSGARNTPGGADPWGGCFPGPNNTGVPAGTSLTVIGSSGQGWTFSPGQRLLEIKSCGVVLNAVKVPGDVYLDSSASNGTHSASTPCVTITNSEIDGFVDVQDTDGSQAGGPLVLTDDTVDTPNTDDDRSPVLSENYYATGLNVEGARLGFSCRGFCTITDSYAHDGFLEQEFHYNAVGSNGLEGPLVIEHDSLACDFSNTDQTAINNGAGCSDDIGLFGDFDPISNVTVDKSLFVSSSAAFGGVPYCIDTNNPNSGKTFPNATNEVVTNNVFQRGVRPANDGSNRCGQYGPVYAWTNGNGNVWSGNTWDDGKPLNEG